MRTSIARQGLMLCLVMAAMVVLAQLSPAQSWQGGRTGILQPEAEQLLALANQARATHGAGPLRWDPSLAAAARQHCLRMAAEGPISHQYRGEADLSERAGQAGAHFSLIEENVAIGPDPAAIHEEWMNSPGHRTNLLNPDVDRMGVAVVASRGVLYAVADYAQVVPVLTPAQVETAVANLVRVSGVTILRDPTTARAYCAGAKSARGTGQTMFAMLWQESNLNRLPQTLVDKLSSAQYTQAAVGSCPAEGVAGTFSAYRVAVLLY